MTRRRSASAHADGGGDFFDRFRAALSRLPDGLIRVMPPAPAEALARAESALGEPLPPAYASFLRSFDGADLFHEAVIIAGVGPSAPRALLDLPRDWPGELAFAESVSGDVFTIASDGRIIRRDPGADERAVAGSSFGRWLDAIVAREQILFGPDGEFAPDMFDPSGLEVLPQIALRQAERALKADPGAADAAHARGVALVRLDRKVPAMEAFEAAAALDTDNAWPLFDLGRAALELGQASEALIAFRRAAERETGPTGARLYAWATRAAVAAGDAVGAETLRREALARDAALVAGLEHAAREATHENDAEALAEAVALLEAVAPGVLLPRRLRVLGDEHVQAAPKARVTPATAEPEPRPPRPDRPRRPARGGRRPASGSRRGSRR